MPKNASTGKPEHEPVREPEGEAGDQIAGHGETNGEQPVPSPR